MSWIIVFVVIFAVFFLLFMRGAGKLNQQYDELMENFKHE